MTAVKQGFRLVSLPRTGDADTWYEDALGGLVAVGLVVVAIFLDLWVLEDS